MVSRELKEKGFLSTAERVSVGTIQLHGSSGAGSPEYHQTPDGYRELITAMNKALHSSHEQEVAVRASIELKLDR